MTRFLFVACLALAACHSGGAPAENAALPHGGLAALRGTWLLVSENSHGDTLIYRRNTYRFRYRPGGRPGFRLGPNGRFTRYDLAEGGGLQALDGTWTETNGNALRIHLSELPPAHPDYTLRFVSYEQNVLTLIQQL